MTTVVGEKEDQTILDVEYHARLMLNFENAAAKARDTGDDQHPTAQTERPAIYRHLNAVQNLCGGQQQASGAYRSPHGPSWATGDTQPTPAPRHGLCALIRVPGCRVHRRWGFAIDCKSGKYRSQ